MLSTLLLLLACNGGDPDDTSPATSPPDTADGDTADTGTDTADTGSADTSDSTDTSDSADTSDTADTDPPVAACDLRTPYKGCTAVGQIDTSSRDYAFTAAWDAYGFPTEEVYYTDLTSTTRMLTRRYTWTDGKLSRLETVHPDGYVMDVKSYVYNAEGRVDTYAWEEGDRLLIRTRFTYTADGYVQRKESYYLGGATDACDLRWTSTASGATYEETCGDGNYTGEVDARMLETARSLFTGSTQRWALTRTFRDDCQPLEQVKDVAGTDNDGGLAYIYDAAGRSVQVTTVGDPGEGTPYLGYVSVATLTYTCPG